MGGIRIFVNRRETKREQFTLSDPKGKEPDEQHWIDLRSELSGNELSRLELAMVKRSRVNLQTGDAQLDMADIEADEIAAWVKAWSFTGPGGEPVPVTFDNIRAMAKPIFDRLLKIVEAHAKEAGEARAERENPTDSSAGEDRSSSASETKTESSSPTTHAGSGTSSPPTPALETADPASPSES